MQCDSNFRIFLRAVSQPDQHRNHAMDQHALFLFTITEAALSLSPGPAVMLVIASALAHGWRHATAASAGILSGNAIYFLLSALGISSLINQAPVVYQLLKYLGAAYLLYLAWLALTGRPSLLSLHRTQSEKIPALSLYKHAVLLQLLNPKTLMMFVAILPQFVNSDQAIAPQMLALAACSMIPEFIILTGYGVLASKAANYVSSERFNLLLERLAGSFMLLAALMVLIN